MISEEHCLNMREILYNRMKNYRGEYSKGALRKPDYEKINNNNSNQKNSTIQNNQQNKQINNVNQEEDSVTMKIESRDSKKVMNNLLNEILERKSTTRLSRGHLEESKISETKKQYEESKENPFYGRDSANKRPSETALNTSIGYKPAENRFRRNKRKDDQSGSIVSNEQSFNNNQEELLRKDKEGKSRGKDATAEMDSINMNIENSMLRQKFQNLRVESISSNEISFHGSKKPIAEQHIDESGGCCKNGLNCIII